jgi:hypothetical protein
VEPREWLAYIETQREHSVAQQRWIEELERRDADRVEALERLADAEQELAKARAFGTPSEHTRVDQGAAAELQYLRAQMSAVKASASWRVTAPLRRAAAVARRLR